MRTIFCPNCSKKYGVSECIITGDGVNMICPGCKSNLMRLLGGLAVSDDPAFNYGLSPEIDTFTSKPVILSEGDCLHNERFEIKAFLGEGSYGSVYCVFDKQMEMDLALKLIAIPVTRMPYVAEYLAREFRIREKIKDRRHILNGYLPIHCEHKGLSLLMMPMELADNGSLRNWMIENQDVHKRKALALMYFQQLCRGVGAIHDAGLVHLDLKPENVLLVDDVVKISDFGLSCDLAEHGRVIPSMKWDESVAAQYTAPELIVAARPKDIGSAADIYSLGCILFELLDGEAPYVGTLGQILEKRDRGIKPRLKDVDDSLASIIWKCLEYDPSNRFSDAAELYGVLYEKTISDDQHETKLNTVYERFDMYWDSSRPEEKFFHKVQKWIPDALEILQGSADKGDLDAMYRLGILYFLADGVGEDKVEAFKLWKLAAEQGHGLSQFNIGLCYDYGQGRPENKAEAVKWYFMAAEEGVTDAQKALGNCYYYGDGVPEDKTEAVKWYHRAATGGNAVAQCNLGYCYQRGIGVPTDRRAAETWLRKASEQGYQEATRLLDLL